MVCGSDTPRALVASTVDLSSGDMAQLIPEEEQRRPDTQLQNDAAAAASHEARNASANRNMQPQCMRSMRSRQGAIKFRLCDVPGVLHEDALKSAQLTLQPVQIDWPDKYRIHSLSRHRQ